MADEENIPPRFRTKPFSKFCRTHSLPSTASHDSCLSVLGGARRAAESTMCGGCELRPSTGGAASRTARRGQKLRWGEQRRRAAGLMACGAARPRARRQHGGKQMRRPAGRREWSSILEESIGPNLAARFDSPAREGSHPAIEQIKSELQFVHAKEEKALRKWIIL